MYYAAYVSREGEGWFAEFPDAPGCQTEADSEEELRAAAQEALQGWLEAHLVSGRVPQRPQERERAPRGRKLWWIPVSSTVAAPVILRWARDDQGLTQADLAKRMGVAQQQVARLEDPDANPTLKSLAKAADALGVDLNLELRAKQSA